VVPGADDDATLVRPDKEEELPNPTPLAQRAPVAADSNSSTGMQKRSEHILDTMQKTNDATFFSRPSKMRQRGAEETAGGAALRSCCGGDATSSSPSPGRE
jgi:hypothetical protein